MRALALALLVVAPPLAAQAPTPPPPPSPARAETDAPPAAGSGLDEAPSFGLAQRLLRSGQTAEAIALFEDLRAASPASVPLWIALKDAYVTAQRWDDALALVAERERATGASATWAAERGALLHRAGRPDEAVAAWDAALAVSPDNEMTYRLVADQMATLRLYGEAAAVFAAGAARLADPTLFTLERAELLGRAGDVNEASRLFLDAASREPRLVVPIRNALVRLLDADGAADAFASAADAALARDPSSRAVRQLVGWIALERGDYRRALDATRALDRLNREEGRGLIDFAGTAEAAGALDEAEAALDEAATRYPGTPVADDAVRLRARLSARRADGERADRGPTPHADAARAAFDSLGEAALTADDRLTLGRLLRDVYADYAAAQRVLEHAAAGSDAAAAQARLALGDVAVRAGDLDAARERFASVESEVRLGPAAEQARFELALLDFYEGLVYSALARAEAMDENTAADVSNDAISLRVTLQENITEVGADTVSAALRAYAAASLRHRRGQSADALAALDSLLAAAPGHPITDELLFLRGHVLRALDRPADAVASWDQLARADPTSFFRDRALLAQASTLEEGGDLAGAAARYEQLLTLFPASLFAPEARQHLRRLRTSS